MILFCFGNFGGFIQPLPQSALAVLKYSNEEKEQFWAEIFARVHTGWNLGGRIGITFKQR